MSARKWPRLNASVAKLCGQDCASSVCENSFRQSCHKCLYCPCLFKTLKYMLQWWCSIVARLRLVLAAAMAELSRAWQELANVLRLELDGGGFDFFGVWQDVILW